MTRAYKLYPIHKTYKGLQMTYANIDWTIQDLPKRVLVPEFAWGEIAQDIRLQIIVNTALTMDIDCQDSLGVVYNPYNNYLEFFVTDKELDENGLLKEEESYDMEDVFN